MNDDVWLVIPLYNEETVIEDVVRQARMTFPNVCCVDDGSSDGSVAAAQRGGAVVVSQTIEVMARVVPLAPRLTAEEAAAHAQMVAKLGDKAIWAKYGLGGAKQ